MVHHGRDVTSKVLSVINKLRSGRDIRPWIQDEPVAGIRKGLCSIDQSHRWFSTAEEILAI